MRVKYAKVVDLLVDAVKELNVPCGAVVEPAPAEPSEAERRADTVDWMRGSMDNLESNLESDGADAADAAAEHGATFLASSARLPVSSVRALPVKVVAKPAPLKKPALLDVKKLTDTVARERAARMKAESNLRNTQMEKAELQQELATAQAEKAELETSLEAAQNEVEQVSDLGEENAELRKRLDTEIADLKDMNFIVAAASKRLAEAKSAIETAISIFERLTMKSEKEPPPHAIDDLKGALLRTKKEVGAAHDVLLSDDGS
jgi:hypothetical protein